MKYYCLFIDKFEKNEKVFASGLKDVDSEKPIGKILDLKIKNNICSLLLEVERMSISNDLMTYGFEIRHFEKSRLQGNLIFKPISRQMENLVNSIRSCFYQSLIYVDFVVAERLSFEGGKFFDENIGNCFITEIKNETERRKVLKQ